MTIQYETYFNSLGDEYVKATLEDGRLLFIPNDPANSDYQRYLRWLNGEEENGTIS
jgi:hypothetical protein